MEDDGHVRKICCMDFEDFGSNKDIDPVALEERTDSLTSAIEPDYLSLPAFLAPDYFTKERGIKILIKDLLSFISIRKG